ncbi:hypothetical protein J4573_29225 [Actinomadura barringtoniae]|uniref:Uncharacterized protein n=1 Tax=Actinomadura barringtoniae TaxID=1427535 RepID=A0A939T9B8_9ACTN|nr:hypothetical protein [Actinomadura barringtoniae]MBO2451207.1 hypothetical protein [Actinomadura barringtoniae]
MEIELGIAGPVANEIIRAEFAHLGDERDPELIREGSRELRERARVFGHSLEIGALLDRADDLEASSG